MLYTRSLLMEVAVVVLEKYGDGQKYIIDNIRGIPRRVLCSEVFEASKYSLNTAEGAPQILGKFEQRTALKCTKHWCVTQYVVRDSAF